MMNPDAGIRLAYIARDDVILAEARAPWSLVHNRYASMASETLYRDAVTKTSDLLREMAATPGWEFVKLPRLYRRDIPIRLRGAKFHIQEGHIIWTVGCVYDFDAVNNTSRMQSWFKNVLEAPLSVKKFVEHVEKKSRDFRQGDDDVWLTGGNLALQHQFAPTLEDIMHNMAWYDNLVQREEEIDELRSIMERNIDTLIERGVRGETVLEKAEEMRQEANMFRRNTKALNDSMRRKWYRTVALYGLAGGTAVATAIAVPCVLLL